MIILIWNRCSRLSKWKCAKVCKSFVKTTAMTTGWTEIRQGNFLKTLFKNWPNTAGWVSIPRLSTAVRAWVLPKAPS